MFIGPHDMLSEGTLVMVGSLNGTVKKCDYVPAHPCGMIAVHTIRFTERRISKRLRSGVMTVKTEPIKPVTRRINYASIQLAQH